MSADIAVVGAGIAGLAVAAALQRRGHTVTVLEQRAELSPGSGISIWPNALAALDDIGVGDDVRQAGGRVTAGAIRWRDGGWLRRPSPRRIVDALGEPLVVVRRSILTDILRDAAQPGTLQAGVTVSAVSIQAHSARIQFIDGSFREFDAVVGADGVNSVVARSINGPLRRRYTGYTAWRGVARHRLDPELAGETLALGAQVGHVPLDADHTYWFATERAPEGSRRPEGEHAYLTARLARWAQPIPQLVAATEPGTLLRNDLYDRTRAAHWSLGAAVLIGDAAHPMRPHLGQGGCQALEDAAILARFTDLAADLPTAFRHFAAFRARRVGVIVREAQTIGRIVGLRPAFLGGLAGRATALLPERMVTAHLAWIAGRTAFTPPEPADLAD